MFARTFIKHCKDGNLEMAMIESKYVESPDYNKAFVTSCVYGHIEIAKWLHSLGVDIHAHDEYAFGLSCRNGHIEIAKWLHSLGIDIHADDEYAFRLSHANSHTDIEKWLLTLYEDTTCLIEYLTCNITTIALYKNGNNIVAMGNVVSTETTEDEAMELYLKDTLSIRKKNFTKKAF